MGNELYTPVLPSVTIIYHATLPPRHGLCLYKCCKWVVIRIRELASQRSKGTRVVCNSRRAFRTQSARFINSSFICVSNFCAKAISRFEDVVEIHEWEIVFPFGVFPLNDLAYYQTGGVFQEILLGVRVTKNSGFILFSPEVINICFEVRVSRRPRNHAIIFSRRPMFPISVDQSRLVFEACPSVIWLYVNRIGVGFVLASHRHPLTMSPHKLARKKHISSAFTDKTRLAACAACV